jgi:hypothetical protein
MLCKDATIADITPELGYVVKSGAAQSTYQSFPATAASSSNMIFSVQVPSENIVIGRDVLLETDMAFNFNVGSQTTPYVITGQKPANSYIIGWGRECALNSFPLSMCMTTATSTINNTSVSVNLQDILPQLLRLNDSRCLYAYNGTTPSLPDQAYYNYANGVGALNNPLGSYNNAGQDVCLVPRGAFPVELVVRHFVQFGAGQPFVLFNNSLQVAADDNPTPPVLPTAATGQYWEVYVKFKVSEPLFISPFTWSDPKHNAQGLLGINNMSFNFNIDSTLKRLMCDGSNLSVGDVPLVALGGVRAGTTGFSQALPLPASAFTNPNSSVSENFQVQSGLFNNTNMLLKFLSTQPSDRLETKNVVPFMDFPRYLTNAQNNAPIASKASSKILSNNLQLNQLPDYFIICARKQMSSMTPQDANAFLAIRKISVNLNNASGLLSSAKAQDLWRMSIENGSTQSFAEFSGKQWSFANGVDGVNVGEVINESPQGGKNVPTTGSLLVLSPPYNLSLPDYLTSGSLGNFNFQIEVDVENQSEETITPELCVICVNSGIFITQQGVSSVYSGILTREQTLKTKSMPSTDMGFRQVGGRLLNRHALVKMARKIGGNIAGAGRGSLEGLY